MPQAYPLAWPDNIPRWTKPREKGLFKTTLSQALKNVEDSLRLFGENSGKPIKEMTISSNVTLGAYKPADPGVAVWFTWEDQQICIPVDRYSSVEANLQAIHHVLEARRVELRHGTLALVRATMKGFVALPAPPDWRKILGLPTATGPGAPQPTPDIVNTYWKAACIKASQEGRDLTDINVARDRALKELKDA